MKTEVIDNLNKMISNPRCELNYSKDYELLIATVLSAQCTDKRVNEVTKVLFSKYDLLGLMNANIKDIENIIMPCGTYTRKAQYVVDIARKLVNECHGIVPNDREYLELLPGVGRKTCNVILANIYNEPTMAVDTHVERVSKRLNLCDEADDVRTIESKLESVFPKDEWNRVNDQLVLFGRYICKSKSPNCEDCLFKNCKYKKKK